MRHSLLRLIRLSGRMAALTLGAFLLLNVAAYGLFDLIRTRGGGTALDQYFIPPLSSEGRAILQQRMPASEREPALSLLASDPGIRPHAVLAFTEGFSTPGYRIGVESIRYEPGWTDSQVEEWLREQPGPVFVFGGSTAFGHGVEGGKTVAAELHRLDPDRVYLNLAVQAADSLREVDLLLHLLRLGYRPSQVIFLDGLNDLTTFAWSPFRDQDKPRIQTLLMDRGEIPLITGHPRSNNMLRAFIFSLPAVQLIAHWRWQGRFAEHQFHQVGADRSPLDWQELMFFYLGWVEFQPSRGEELAEEWIRYYARNVDFVRRLGKEFGFRVDFVLQPIGPALEGNLFLRPEFLGSELQRLYQTFQGRSRQAVASGRLPIIDCSTSLDAAVQESFIDAAHYTPLGNRLLAGCIGEGIMAAR